MKDESATEHRPETIYHMCIVNGQEIIKSLDKRHF